MRDLWNENAVKLQAELVAGDVKLSADDDVISANAGGWFAAMGANEKASLIATMRNLATIDVHAEKSSPTSSYKMLTGQPTYKFDVAAQASATEAPVSPPT